MKTRLHATAYDLQGSPIREGYKGIIIQNGINIFHDKCPIIKILSATTGVPATYVKRLRRTENVRRTFEGVSAPREFAERT